MTERWDVKNNKFRATKTTKPWPLSNRNIVKVETITSRLRIKNLHYRYGHLMDQIQILCCNTFIVPLAVEHGALEAVQRQRCSGNGLKTTVLWKRSRDNGALEADI